MRKPDPKDTVKKLLVELAMVVVVIIFTIIVVPPIIAGFCWIFKIQC